MEDPTEILALPGCRESNDGDGRSALLLVESLIHGLIAAAAIDRDQALEIAGIALDVQIDLAHERGESPAEAAKSARSLSAICGTLRLVEP